jgi:hypothetical protein
MSAPEFSEILSDSATDRAIEARAADARERAALIAFAEELVSVLCHQPSIPVAHKTDLLNKLGDLKRALGVPVEVK